MHIQSHPTMAQVQLLLGLCGLPGDDIAPEYLPDFFIARDGDQDIGVAGVEIRGSFALIRSVAVHPGQRSRGLGAQLVAAVERRAAERGATQFFLLTNDAQAFFRGRGYAEVSRCSAPAEIQSCGQFGSSCCGGATLMTKAAGA